MAGVDLDRGCIQQMHPNGSLISMYRDAPGVYYGESGQPVRDDVAEAAGFDVKSLRIARRKGELLEEFKAKLDRDFAKAEERAGVAAIRAEEEAEAKAVAEGNAPPPAEEEPSREGEEGETSGDGDGDGEEPEKEGPMPGRRRKKGGGRGR